MKARGSPNTFSSLTRRPRTKRASSCTTTMVTDTVPLLEIINAQQAGSIPKLPTTLGVTTMMIVYSVRLGRLGTAAVREPWTDLCGTGISGARPWTRVANTSVGATASRRRRPRPPRRPRRRPRRRRAPSAATARAKRQFTTTSAPRQFSFLRSDSDLRIMIARVLPPQKRTLGKSKTLLQVLVASWSQFTIA